MSSYRNAFIFAGLALGAVVALASQVPLAVSPGDPEKLLLVEARCPTFSWAAVDGAESYELIVYEVGEQGARAEPVLQQTLPGAVTSWTPSLDRCLVRTGRYAWSVRAATSEGLGEWSTASLFQVAPAPDQLVLEQALEIVRGQLAAEAELFGLSLADALQEREGDAGVTAIEGQDQVARAFNQAVDLRVFGGDIAVSSSGAASQHAYVQLDTIIGPPTPLHCNQVSERGRLLYRMDGDYLYVCDASGWRRELMNTP